MKIADNDTYTPAVITTSGETKVFLEFSIRCQLPQMNGKLPHYCVAPISEWPWHCGSATHWRLSSLATDKVQNFEVLAETHEAVGSDLR